MKKIVLYLLVFGVFAGALFGLGKNYKAQILPKKSLEEGVQRFLNFDDLVRDYADYYHISMEEARDCFEPGVEKSDSYAIITRQLSDSQEGRTPFQIRLYAQISDEQPDQISKVLQSIIYIDDKIFSGFAYFHIENGHQIYYELTGRNMGLGTRIVSPTIAHGDGIYINFSVRNGFYPSQNLYLTGHIPVTS